MRIIGALIEKQYTTPEQYPLSSNALLLACNQKSNRDPVSEYPLHEVEAGVQRLRERGLLRSRQGASERAIKHEHLLHDTFKLGKKEFALLAVLLLRGAQTPGELRTRTERYTPFATLAEVEDSLRRLSSHQPPLAREEPRRPGQSQTRWVQLLGGDPEKQKPRARTAEVSEPSPAERGPSAMARIEALERKVETLEQQLKDLLAQLS